MNVWTAWKTAMRTKTGGDGSLGAVIRQLARNAHRPGRLSWTLRAMDFLRWREFDFALRAIGDLPRPRRMLDLSSPKLLPLTLASAIPSCQCVSTDIIPREVQWTADKSRMLRLGNLACECADARRLAYPSNHFDMVTSISVFEHIAPEHGGDIPAIQEMARVLAPGGFAILTVPFSRSYLADYQRGNVYERQSNGEPIFFQRFYTEQLIERNFVQLSGLQMHRIGFVEEHYFFQDPRKRIAHWINGSAKQTAIFGPMYPLLSHVFLSPPRPLAKCRKPYIACMVLRKPANRLARAA